MCSVRSRNSVAIEVLSNRLARSLLDRTRLSLRVPSSALIVCNSSFSDCSSSLDASNSSLADCSSSLTDRYSSLDDCSSSTVDSSSSDTVRRRSFVNRRSWFRACAASLSSVTMADGAAALCTTEPDFWNSTRNMPLSPAEKSGSTIRLSSSEPSPASIRRASFTTRSPVTAASFSAARAMTRNSECRSANRLRLATPVTGCRYLDVCPENRRMSNCLSTTR